MRKTYEVYRRTNFMGFVETELEAEFETIIEAKQHIEQAKVQEKNLMGSNISHFEIKEKAGK